MIAGRTFWPCLNVGGIAFPSSTRESDGSGPRFHTIRRGVNNRQARSRRSRPTAGTCRDLLAGINDIGCSGLPALCGGYTPGITANKLIDGYKTIIRRVHAKKIKIFGATLTPFARAYTDPYFGPLVTTYWTPAKERIREEVNRWILTSGAFDGVVDFAAAVASPRDPTVMNPIFNGGDQLHPNDPWLRRDGRRRPPPAPHGAFR